MPAATRPRVVIVGAGAAGVFTGYLLQKNAPDRFDITLLEKNSELGGNTRSQLETYDGETVNIDSGAQFFSDTSEPTYCAMLKEEGFFDQPGLLIERDVGVSLWSVTRRQLLFKVPSQLSQILAAAAADPVTWLNFSILTTAAIARFAKEDWTETFGVWLDTVPFALDAEKKAAFKADVARPLMYQFGLVAPSFLDELSARFVVYYYVCSLPWRGGAAPFSLYNSSIGLDGILKQLLEKYGLEARVDTAVKSIRSQGAGYLVTAVDGSAYPADEVVFATNPRWTQALLPADEARFDALRSLLGAMPYLTVPVHVQRDQPSYMPGNQADWSVSNVLVVDGPPGAPPANYMLGVWFGPLRPQKIAADFFKAWGSPALSPADEPKVIEQVHELMVGTPDFMLRREDLRTRFQGENHLWYAGGYILDYDSQNACLKSAANVASRLLSNYAGDAFSAGGTFLVQPGDLPEATFEGRPALLDELERTIQQAAPDAPEVKTWLATRARS